MNYLERTKVETTTKVAIFVCHECWIEYVGILYTGVYCRSLMMAVFIAVILYINKRQTKVSSLGFRDSDKSSNERSYPNYSGSKLTYVCLSCGTKVSDRRCAYEKSGFLDHGYEQ